MIGEQIKKLEERIFLLDMKDNWTKEDFDLMQELELELQILKSKEANK